MGSWLLYFLMPIISNILYIKPHSRNFEYKSDSYANKFGYGEDMASALVKMIHEHEGDVMFHPTKDKDVITSILKKFFGVLNTHPSLNDRIGKLYKGDVDKFMKKMEDEIHEHDIDMELGQSFLFCDPHN